MLSSQRASIFALDTLNCFRNGEHHLVENNRFLPT